MNCFCLWFRIFCGSNFGAAKCGIQKTDSTVATAIRTIVVLIFSWLIVFVAGSQDQIRDIGGKMLLFLVLSGLATGASWLCHFKALQLGDINKVVSILAVQTIPGWHIVQLACLFVLMLWNGSTLLITARKIFHLS